MRTTRMILMILPLAFMALACEKPDPIEEDSLAEVCISIDLGINTKAGNYTTEWTAERTVHSVGYYFFDTQGRLEDVWNVNGGSTVSGKVRSGTKTIWAVVNIPASRFADVRTLSQFEAKGVSFSDMSPSSFPMAGKKSVYVGTGNVTTSIPVERFAARVCVAEVRNEMSGIYEGEDIEIIGAFLENVVGNCKITGEAAGTPLWYNRCGRVDGYGSDAVITDDIDVSYGEFTTFNFGDEYLAWEDTSTPYAGLYCFPNSTSTDRTGWSDPFTPRYTRVVLVTYILGDLYYYPVSIPQIRRNHAYSLYLTITHLGSKDPDTFDYVTDQDVVITIGGFDDFDNDFIITY